MEMNSKESHTLSFQIIMMIRLGNLKKFTSIQKRNQKGDKVLSKKMNKRQSNKIINHLKGFRIHSKIALF